MSNPVRAQGAEAKKLGLTEFDNPYGPGDNHDDWRSGFGVGKDTTEQADEDGDVHEVRKGKKDGAKAVVKPTGNGETAVTTVHETADPQAGEGVGAEVTVGDPSASTVAAENDGEGLTLDNDRR